MAPRAGTAGIHTTIFNQRRTVSPRCVGSVLRVLRNLMNHGSERFGKSRLESRFSHGSCVMRSSQSIVPETGQDVYLVLDDFGRPVGRAWRETAEEDANHETLIRDLMDINIPVPRASSLSIPPRAGRAM
jgi:hypothetical protein